MNGSSLKNDVLRALGRANIYRLAAADFRSGILLALFSNHRTQAIASGINGHAGVKIRAAGDAPIFIDFKSGDHQTIFREVFLDQVYCLKNIPFKPQLILDCGAHIGLFSRLAAAGYPDVPIYAFEPNAGNFSWLKRQCNYPNCKINPIEAGVDIREGVGVLFGDGCQGSMLAAANSAAGKNVTVIDLKKWIKDLPPTQRLLIKMDIEGKEFEVLPDILPALPATTALLFETHSNFGNSESLIGILKSNGFLVNEARSRNESDKTFKDCVALRCGS